MNGTVLQNIYDKAVYAYIFMCSVLMSFFASSSPLQSFYLGDSAVFVYVAKVILDGGMPYKDTFDHKGPLIYLIDALGLLINEKIGIWFIELIAIFIIFLFTYKIARLLGCNSLIACFIVTIGASVLTYYFQGGNYTEEYACVFIIVSLYWFLDHFINESIERYKIILCGISFAAVCMLRLNMIALWIVMCIGVLIIYSRKHQKREIINLINNFLIGISIVLVPILMWLFLNNAFEDFVNDYLIFNLRYSSDPKRVSPLNVFESIKFFLSGYPVLLSLPFIIYLSIKKGKIIDSLCGTAFPLSIIMSCISGQKYEHYGIILYPFIIYAFSRIFYEINSFRLNGANTNNSLGKSIRLCLSVLYIGLVFFFLISFIVFSIEVTTGLISVNKEFFLSEEKEVAGIIQTLTSKDERISVVGNGNVFYLLSNRKSATKYSYQYPIALIAPEIRKRYFEEISNLKAKVIIIPPDTRVLSLVDEIMGIIHTKYFVVDILHGYEIYLLK